jgi:hypothetical protein
VLVLVLAQEEQKEQILFIFSMPSAVHEQWMRFHMGLPCNQQKREHMH